MLCMLSHSLIKAFFEQYRDDIWDSLLTNLKLVCEERNINVSDMNIRYVERRDQTHHQQTNFTIEHHYLVDFYFF